jgi:hypothetical protein
MYKGPVPQRMLVDRSKGCTCDQHLDYEACCDIFKQFLNDCKVGLGYLPKDRLFYIRTPLSTSSRVHSIANCPWCGAKLPSYLGDLRMEILENEYGVDNEDDKKQVKKIPTEFFTDEWWKKRGL